MDALFIKACCVILKVEKKLQVRFNVAAAGYKEAAAYYESRYRKGKIIGHVIYVNLDVVYSSNYKVEDVIAHEVCHAAQFEHGLYTGKKGQLYHDKHFQSICSILENALQDTEFKVGKLYNPDIDTE